MSNDVTINVKTNDQATASMATISKNTESMATKIGGSISKVGSQIGGEIGDLVDKVGAGFEKIGESSEHGWGKIAAGSAVVAGVGVAMQSFASKGVQAEAQLKVAVDNTGDSFVDYEKQVSKAEAGGAKFGDTNTQVAGALQILVQATGDTNIALSDLNVTYDLAAAKHISLADAAALIAKIYAGSTKTLKQYGIDMTVTAGNTQQATAAIGALSQKINGQANASVDNFQGKINEGKAWIADWGEKIANVAGGPLTYLGTAASVSSGVLDILAEHTRRNTEALLENATVTDADGYAAQHSADYKAEHAAATEADTVAVDANTASQGRSKLATAGATLGFAAFVVGAYEAGNAINSVVEKNNAFAKAMDNSGKTMETLDQAYQKDGNSVGTYTKQTIAASLAQTDLAGKAAKAGITVDQLTTGVSGTSAQFQKLVDTWKASGKPSGDTLTALDLLHDQTHNLTGSTDALASSTDNAGESAADMAVDLQNTQKAIGTTKDALDATGKSADAVAQAFKEVNGNAEDIFRTSLSVGDGIQSLTDQIASAKQGGDKFSASLDVNTSSGRKNTESILDIIDNINQMTLKSQQAGDTTQQTTDKLNGMNASLQTAAQKAGIGKDALQALITQYETNPKTLAFQATVDATQAFLALDTLQGKIAYYNSSKNTSPAIYAALSEAEHPGSGTQFAHGGIVGAAASGGPRNGSTWVGEHGPELVNLPPGSYVHSNPDSMRMASQQSGQGGASGMTISFGGGTDSAFATAFMKLVRTGVIQIKPS